ncbi:mitochondrial distribution and morphology protein [Sodiomyces alkalinus F11]|uniref:Mitochondrial distribution and morphology protein n=1 Tax=Sodiomyces alkalinus (strain CBS 110278 / VKM F-3762 / F11) TaxID=1314773 RepID=A0A3N2PZA7_SODAK|nr:mitochondrial distribution and morphology protein [Sodiomyces alkalinus F11]ROT39822.1 mitochondrial distribution and morphology protein [Sodiomyces alkalinus F11]
MPTKLSTIFLGRRFLISALESATPLAAPAFLTSTRIALSAAPIHSLTADSSPKFACRRSVHTQRPIPRSSAPHGPNALKSLTSGGLLLIGFTTNVSSSTPSAVAAKCTGAPESATGENSAVGSKIRQLAQQAWRRGLHTDASAWKSDKSSIGERRYSSKSGNEPNKASVSQLNHDDQPQNRREPKPGEPVSRPGHKPESHDHDPESLTSTMSKYLHMPMMPHRPTREELLAAANGFWERMRVRFKWASIRSMRPWNIDEWGAFVSWFLFGHIVWILVGTTTFFSILILSINTVFAQETVAKWVGDYLTQSAGVTIVFESAIVPKWKDGVISFRNVFISRRPGQTTSSVSKGSSTSAAAVAAAGRPHDHDDDDDDEKQTQTQPTEEDEGNYTQFDVTIANVNVTLSFLKWWNGKGLLKDVEVKGVRGVIDRTSVQWSGEAVDPLSYRHEHQPGDFEIDFFRLEDLLVTIHQPNDFRPFSVSIFSAELPQLRKQWLFYDFLSATHMSGSFDGSLFTIHPRQVHGAVAGDNRDLMENVGESSAWKKFSRLRIDGLKIDHLNRGVSGPFGWIYEGNVDIVADVMFPADADESITKVMSDFYDQLEDIVVSNRLRLLQKDIAADPLTALAPEAGHITEASAQNSLGPPEPQDLGMPFSSSSASFEDAPTKTEEEDDRRYLIMDLRIHLNDVKAAVPLFTNDISYVNQALVRPIVAYINAKRTYIPMTCRIVKRASDFDGSWTVFDCGLMDDLSAETYEAFARDVENQQNRVRRLKKVGFWTLSLAVHALFMGMAGTVV